MKRFLLSILILLPLLTTSVARASTQELCLSNFQDSDWQDGQPAGVQLSPDLILSKTSISFVNLNGDYFKINLGTENLRYVNLRIKAGLSQFYFLNSNTKLSIAWVYEGKSCLTRTIQIETTAMEPTQEFSSKTLDVWTNSTQGLDGRLLNFKEVALFKEIFLKAREYVAKNPKISIKYRDFESVKNLTFDDYRGNEFYENPARTMRDYIQKLISSEYKSENPTYLKNLSFVFLQLRSYSPDGCIRFHINDLIRQQSGIEGKGSLYSEQPYGFYYFPKKQDCKFNLVYLNNNLESIPLGQVILQPFIEQKSSILVKKTTITCVKGKQTKKVTAVKPVCPTGYKKK